MRFRAFVLGNRFEMETVPLTLWQTVSAGKCASTSQTLSRGKTAAAAGCTFEMPGMHTYTHIDPRLTPQMVQPRAVKE